MTYEQWCTTILEPILDPEKTIPDELLDTSVIVFSADTDRTQAYVFESDKLPEIRGASRILTILNQGSPRDHTDAAFLELLEEEHLPADCLIYASGGGVLALLPSDEIVARSLADNLKQRYLDQTGLATISVETREFSTRHVAYRFGEVMQLMGLLLRASKARRMVPFFERMPFASVCASCQNRAANDTAHGDDEQEYPICWICQRKLEKGGRRYENRTYWIDALAEKLQARGYDANAFPPRDLDQLARGGEIAFIYADGDSIGEKLRTLQNPSGYKTFSNTLYSITEDAVVEAIVKSGLVPYPDKDDQSYIAPWEIITIGGDDVMIIVPAEAAFEFAECLAEEFASAALTQLSDFFGERPLTMSVGIALGKVKTPVRLLRETAYRLLKEAKRLSREVHEPCIDFHNFVTEGIPGESLPAWREEVFSIERTPSVVLTTGRPFTLTGFKNLLEGVHELRKVSFPRSQMNVLVSGITQRREQGTMFYGYQRARMSKEHRRILDELCEMWHDNAEWPWLPTGVGGDVYTILPDLAQIL